MDDAASGQDRSALDRPDVMRDLVRDIQAALEEIPNRACEVRMMLDSLTDEEFDRGLDGIATTPAHLPISARHLQRLYLTSNLEAQRSPPVTTSSRRSRGISIPVPEA